MLRVCVDARHPDGPHTGVRAAISGLASALARLDGDERYFFLAYPDSHNWLLPFLRGPCTILPTPGLARWNLLVRSIPGGQRICRAAARIAHGAPKVPVSDGTIEKAGIDVMHFTSPLGFVTRVRSIYQLHDLQHLHFPQFVTAKAWRWQEFLYRGMCQQAAMVVTMSMSGKDDLTHNYGLPQEKVKVVPWAPVLATYPTPTAAELERVQQKFALPPRFIFYPAQTWKHKNHLGLIEAIAQLRDRHGIEAPLICSGNQTAFFSEIRKRVRQLKLESQIRFLGFVASAELYCLYKLSRCLVFPSHFEGWGLPLLEAFLAGTPAACSRISPLTEQAAGSALLFDPNRPEEIAEAVLRLWTDEALRRELVNSGGERVNAFNWDRTARLFRAHYRAVGRRQLSEEDHALLAAPPLA